MLQSRSALIKPSIKWKSTYPTYRVTKCWINLGKNTVNVANLLQNWYGTSTCIPYRVILAIPGDPKCWQNKKTFSQFNAFENIIFKISIIRPKYIKYPFLMSVKGVWYDARQARHKVLPEKKIYFHVHYTHIVTLHTCMQSLLTHLDTRSMYLVHA